MNYKIFILFFFLLSCKVYDNTQVQESIIFDKTFSNSGFALIYDEKFKKNKIVSKSLDERSLDIFQKNLKKNTLVKITNVSNNKSLIAKVSSSSKYPNFYNSVLSLRIAEELELDLTEPYIEIISIPKGSTFVAKKAKMFEEEKSVAEKAPVDGIQISNLNIKKQNKKIISNKKFSYSIKVADFYYKNTAKIMVERIRNETLINNLKIIKLSETKYRVLIGPFNDIKSLKETFEKMNLLEFENLEILKNV